MIEYKYGDWWIVLNEKPGPNYDFDYDYYHIDYDGAEDSGDIRCGNTKSILHAMDEIDAIEKELE